MADERAGFELGAVVQGLADIRGDIAEMRSEHRELSREMRDGIHDLHQDLSTKVSKRTFYIVLLGLALILAGAIQVDWNRVIPAASTASSLAKP